MSGMAIMRGRVVAVSGATGVEPDHLKKYCWSGIGRRIAGSIETVFQNSPISRLPGAAICRPSGSTRIYFYDSNRAAKVVRALTKSQQHLMITDPRLTTSVTISDDPSWPADRAQKCWANAQQGKLLHKSR
jgi:hypothetical protein